MTTACLVFALALSWLAVVIPRPALVAEAQTLDEEAKSTLRRPAGPPRAPTPTPSSWAMKVS
jgi:hypothetical protein